MTIEQTIQHVLNTTYDPILKQTAAELQLQATLHMEGHHATLSLSADFPTNELKQTYLPVLQKAIHHQLPQLNVSISMDHVIKAHRTQLPGKGLRGIKNTIAIASGKGGVGKSTVTVNIATALAKLGARVGILDADIYGPSIPLMLGKTEPVQCVDDRYLPVRAHGVQAMSIGYLTNESNSTLIWRGPMLAKSLIQMIDLTAWDELDYLFIDLPPGTGDIQLSLVQKIPLTGAIIVTTPQQVATLDAEKAITLFEKTGIHVFGLVENMTQHLCTQCGHQTPFFGAGGAMELCKKHHCELLGQLPLDPQMSQDGDQGIPTALKPQSKPAEIFTSIALKTAISISKRPLNYADKFPPIVIE